MKKLCILGLLILMLVGIAVSQQLPASSVAQFAYAYKGAFPDTNVFKLPFETINGGLGVDPEGKVWIQPYTNSLIDSIDVGGGVYARLRPIYVFTPNGTQASFSPIKILTGPNELGVSVTDTMKGFFGYGGCINPANGNFLAVWYGKIWEIDYKTGQGVHFTQTIASIGANSPASVAASDLGEIYLCRVVGPAPGQVLNPDFTSGPQFAAEVPAIGRTIGVSRDGNDVYAPRFTAAPPTTYRYHSDAGTLGAYTLADSTILLGASVESIAMHPTTGYVWMSADRRSDSTFQTHGSPNSYYAYNPSTKAIVDSFKVDAWPALTTLPRGIAFSPTGDTVYVGKFDGPGLPAVVRFVKELTKVERTDGTVPANYTLSQNFPNPFNPTTEIQFQIRTSGLVSLRVYDVLGREVATLVNEEMVAGSYRAAFNATKLTSGTYMYELRAGETRLVKKMTLLK